MRRALSDPERARQLLSWLEVLLRILRILRLRFPSQMMFEPESLDPRMQVLEGLMLPWWYLEPHQTLPVLEQQQQQQAWLLHRN